VSAIKRSSPQSEFGAYFASRLKEAEEQAISGLGMESQLLAINAEPVKRDLPVLAVWWEPGVSGKNLKRPALTGALAELESGDGSILMVAKLNIVVEAGH
jgi:DNA invertase Pin-like site-specific DNA recombinase